MRKPIVVSVICLVSLVPMKTASAKGHSCGDVIAKDTILRDDLRHCPGRGLSIGADYITLDLNGHDVTGKGDGNGIELHGHTGVTIKNGTVRGFFNDIDLSFATDSVIKHVTATKASRDGVAIDSSGSNHVLNSVISGAIDGIDVENSDFSDIEHNHLVGGGGGGVSLTLGSDNSVVRDNHLALSEWGVIIDDAANTDLERNVAEHNGTGISLRQSDESSVIGNVADRNLANGIEITDPAASATLTNNRADHNGGTGIVSTPAVTDGGGNEAHGNGSGTQCVNIAC